MQKIRATALVVRDEKVLMVHRFRDGEEYYVLPGGMTEEGESIEDAVLRELKEETTLEGSGLKEVLDYTDDICRNRIFLIGNFEGEVVKLSENSPEYKKQNEKDQYSVEWVPVNEILFLTIWPMQTREFLFKYFKLA
ncbi:MAG: MutT/Nudix [Candidatus Nomurabacteria bacterium GW2011_GWB1_40_7]|uniref:MutT/Nudix n=1 Tax=Candidatus Nomurabacteria bacterium GW2011_GWB1_40_7 TaxID=1618744 RepID=A0A0G0W4C1_9BACT|nr:MAG: MutT/Nudix [Candidatus Nomurabacteria bacterium GW2011_GWB1_40_7]